MLPFLVLQDPESKVFRQVYKLDRVPTHVIVDTYGQIVYLQTARRTRNSDEENKLLLEIRHLLAYHDRDDL